MSGQRRVVLAALAGNVAVSVTKFGAFALTHSTAMLTEAIHSLVDTADQLLLLVGQQRAARPASRTHPFGYGLEAYFWSLVVALIIFLAGGAVSVWEGAQRISAPRAIESPWVSFLVLAASAVFEGLSFREAYREYRNTVRDSDVALFSFIRMSKDPSVFGTLLEDGGALIGLALAALGVAGAAFVDLPWADGAASVAIGVLLLGVAVVIGNETRSLIAGEGAAPAIQGLIREAAGRAAAPLTVRDLATLQLGPRTILVVIAFEPAPDVSRSALRNALEAVTAACRAADERVLEVLYRP